MKLQSKCITVLSDRTSENIVQNKGRSHLFDLKRLLRQLEGKHTPVHNTSQQINRKQIFNILHNGYAQNAVQTFRIPTR